MHTVFALLCFVVVIHWLIFPYPPGLLYWHCGNLTIAPVPAKQPWWIWINTSCEFIMNDCITTTKQSTTKPCAYFLGYTVSHTPTWTCVACCSVTIVYSISWTKMNMHWEKITFAWKGIVLLCHICSGYTLIHFLWWFGTAYVITSIITGGIKLLIHSQTSTVHPLMFENG